MGLSFLYTRRVIRLITEPFKRLMGATAKRMKVIMFVIAPDREALGKEVPDRMAPGREAVVKRRACS